MSSDLELWEAITEQFYKDTGYMRPGKDDARGFHTYEERCAAFDVWTKMRFKYCTTPNDRDAHP